MASRLQNVASYVLVMSKKSIDPTKIWLHANGFYTACQILIEIDIDSNPDTAAEIGHAVVALSALNSELFFKCLICIETGAVPHGHHLHALFQKVSPTTRSRIEHIWDTEVVPKRTRMWDAIDEKDTGLPVKRDLPSALMAGNRAFEKARYNYEGQSKDTNFYISDLPRLLGRVILEKKPEWASLRRRKATKITG